MNRMNKLNAYGIRTSCHCPPYPAQPACLGCPEQIIQILKPILAGYNMQFNMVRVLADADLVAVRCHAAPPPGEKRGRYRSARKQGRATIPFLMSVDGAE